MNNKIIFDASAVVALLAKEKGFEVIKRHLKNAIISSVNISEVYKYCIDKQNLAADECKNIMGISGIKIIDFDEKQALIAADIYPKTKEYGLSLGDRACIALAIEKKYPILTCDKIWEKINLDVKFIMVR